MLRSALALVVGLVAVAAAAAVDDLPRAPVAVKVVDVLDGDTVRVLGWPHNVRLASIDAPEIGHGYRRPGQPHSQVARHTLGSMLSAAQQVTARCYERDLHERPVCDLFADGASVGRLMVERGYAWAFTASNGRYLRDRSLVQVERSARSARVGLWRDARPIEPWSWRRECWQGGVCPAPD